MEDFLNEKNKYLDFSWESKVIFKAKVCVFIYI